MPNKYICNCKNFDFFKKDYTYWENRKTTSDEVDITNYIKENFNLNNKSILHIGIGNSEIALLYSPISIIVGITISSGEYQKAKRLNLQNYTVHMCDKYSNNFYDIMKNYKFDFIIDANLKSYSCCSKSFNNMFLNYAKILSQDGKIITSRNGMNWYKKLQPKLSFNFKNFFHYKLKEIDGDKSNILNLNELGKLSKDHKLNLTYNERVLYLSK